MMFHPFAQVRSRRAKDRTTCRQALSSRLGGLLLSHERLLPVSHLLVERHKFRSLTIFGQLQNGDFDCPAGLVGCCKNRSTFERFEEYRGFASKFPFSLSIEVVANEDRQFVKNVADLGRAAGQLPISFEGANNAH